jgi:hypothetical protein
VFVRRWNPISPPCFVASAPLPSGQQMLVRTSPFGVLCIQIWNDRPPLLRRDERRIMIDHPFIPGSSIRHNSAHAVYYFWFSPPSFQRVSDSRL